MLMNRVEREARAVSQSFDAITADAVAHLEEMYGRTAQLLFAQVKFGNWPEESIQRTGGAVLTNALKSLTAAFAVLRMGWRIQPHLSVRNGMEAASVVLHLIQHPRDLTRLLEGRLDSAKTVNSARSAFPPFGHLYGLLSRQFVHVGKPFLYIQEGSTYAESELQMWFGLACIADLSLITYMTAEALFIDGVAEPVYWARTEGGQLKERRSAVIEEWRRNFLRIYRSHLPQATL